MTELIDSHIKSLCLRNKGEYQNWCLQNGFSTSIKKSARKFSVEQQYFNEQQHTKSLSKHRIPAFKEVIEEIRKRPLKYSNSSNKIEQNYNTLKKSKSQEASLYLDVLLYLDSIGSKLSQDARTVQSVAIAQI